MSLSKKTESPILRHLAMKKGRLSPCFALNFTSTEHDPRERRHVFVCGYLQDSVGHNEMLDFICVDLIQHYFVTANSLGQFNSEAAHDVLQPCDVFVLFMNECTLQDRACLQLLDSAAFLNIAIVFVRAPNCRVRISPPQPRQAQHLQIHQPECELDLGRLHKVLYEQHRHAIVYDVLHRSECCSRLLDHLNALFHGSRSESNRSPQPQQKAPAETLNSAWYSQQKSLCEVSQKSHCHSAKTDDDKKKKGPPKLLREGSDIKQSRSRLPMRRRTTVDGTEHKRMSSKLELPIPMTSDRSTQSSARSASPSTETNRTSTTESSDLSPLGITDTSFIARVTTTAEVNPNCATNFKQTQYLMFHMTERTLKPRLIRFPEDVIGSSEDVNVGLERADAEEGYGSPRGSDTSLEEAAELVAPIIAQNLENMITPRLNNYEPDL